jgi:protein O-GlcNAc transferase
VRLLLGSILAEDGVRPESIEQLAEAVRLRPRSAEAQNALGEAFNAFGESKMARAAFAKAVALDPAFAAAQVNLGQILVEAKEFDAASEHLDRALRSLGTSPDAALAHYLRAKVNTEHNETQEAVRHLEQAVSLRPDFAEAWSDLGQARKTLLDSAGALIAFQKAVAASPDDAVSQYRLGSEYLQRGEGLPAIQHLEKSLQLTPDDQSTLFALQIAYRRNGQLERAAEMKARLTGLLRKRDEAAQHALAAVQINNEGAALEKAGNLHGALEKYRAALDLSPEHVGIRVNYAAALLHLGQLNEGILELREALRRDPDNSAIRQALDRALAKVSPDRGGKQ